ncbi:MAG: RodZ domain-containing protein [Sideroxydans sp.]
MSEVQSDSAASNTADQYLIIGNTLRAAREVLGLSSQEIADRIKFSVRQVDAMERGDIEHLPQGTFLRGFIRSYARVVNIDPAPLLADTEMHSEHHFDVTDVQAGGVLLPVVGADHKNLYALLGALIIAIGLAWFLFSPHNDGLRLISDSSNMVQPELTIETVSDVATTTTDVEIDKDSPSAATDVKKEPFGSQAADLPKAEINTETPSAKREIPLEQLMKRPIHIVYEADAWVEIRDVNDEVLISRVTQAGDEKWIGGARRAPYQVTIGRAGAIRLYYMGHEIDLSGFKPDSVARLVLE